MRNFLVLSLSLSSVTVIVIVIVVVICGCVSSNVSRRKQAKGERKAGGEDVLFFIIRQHTQPCRHHYMIWSINWEESLYHVLR